MIGDINFFVYPWDEEDGQAPQSYCTGEIDIMIAGQQDRGRGLGKAAVSTFLHYIWSSLDAILREYESSSSGQAEGTPRLKLKLFMAKIKATNAHSIALFKSLGFEQEGDVNYFGEIKLVLQDFDLIAAPPEDYQVLDYSR